uniref:Crystalline alpha B-like protein n=1 Tax=Acartia pacifica TaxID=335913 RepID=R9TI05_ACAPC|nr:crystalline alpha B-like protein [Acartia pacifica]
MLCSTAKIVARRGWTPVVKASRSKVDVTEWINSHRKFDRMLYEMMPSSFAEFQGDNYPKSLQQSGKDGTVVTHNDPLGYVMKDFFTPFFTGRLVTPMFEELEKLETGMGATEMTQDEKSINYAINVKDFKPESIKIDLVGDVLKIVAREEFKEVSEGVSRSEVREMSKNILVPRGMHAKDLKTVLSEDGLLKITIPKPEVISIQLEKEQPLKIEKETPNPDKKTAAA